MILLFDPAAFGGAESFALRGEEMLAEIIAQEGARLPGDRRLVLREQAARDGVEIPDALYEDIMARAASN
jgi:(2R)-3-sulfolactate dehydrogenase (NADP+)